MTTANNYGHQALSAIEAYILSLENENIRLHAEIDRLARIYFYDAHSRAEDARHDLAIPQAALCPGEQA